LKDDSCEEWLTLATRLLPHACHRVLRLKHILDPSFRYTPSFATDLRKTFKRIRRQQQAQAHANVKIESAANVLQLNQSKKRRLVAIAEVGGNK
jgi:hypothetical protein